MLISYARHAPVRRRVAILAIVSLLGSPTAPLVMAQAPPAAAATEPPDGGWPRAYTTASGAALAVYQPQVSSWADQKHAVLYAAVSYTPKGAKAPALGTLKVESETSVALDERLVSFSEFKITESNFPTLQRDQLKPTVEEIDGVGAARGARDRARSRTGEHRHQPDHPEERRRREGGSAADLLQPDARGARQHRRRSDLGADPAERPDSRRSTRTGICSSTVRRRPITSATTPVWLKAADVKGPWAPAGTLPESFAKLPDDGNWKEVKASLPGKKVSASQAPKVFVSLQPAELILLRGEPNYVTVEGAAPLLWVSNTESDVFRMGPKGAVYYLVAGRWFSAPDFTGPWTFATPTLPADFKKIPLEHERSRVLASVPGTTQAAEAMLLAQVPQTARVSKTVQAPEVEYQGGKPEFQPIEKTTVQRAVNTDKDILKVGDLYYMCFQGVWFMSTDADRAVGGHRRGAEADLRDPCELAVA